MYVQNEIGLNLYLNYVCIDLKKERKKKRKFIVIAVTHKENTSTFSKEQVETVKMVNS